MSCHIRRESIVFDLVIQDLYRIFKLLSFLCVERPVGVVFFIHSHLKVGLIVITQNDGVRDPLSIFHGHFTFRIQRCELADDIPVSKACLFGQSFQRRKIM